MDCATGTMDSVSSTAGNVANVASGLGELFPVSTITKIIEFIELILSPVMTNYIVMSTVAVTAVWMSSLLPNNILGQVIIILLAWSSFVEGVRIMYPSVEGVAQLLAIPIKAGIQITGKKYQITSWSIFMVLTIVRLANRVNIIVPLFVAGRLVVTYHVRKYLNAKKNLENLIPTPEIPSMDSLPTPPIPSMDSVPTPPLPSMDSVPTPPLPSMDSVPTPPLPSMDSVPAPSVPVPDVSSKMDTIPELPSYPLTPPAPSTPSIDTTPTPAPLKNVGQPEKAMKSPSLF